MANEGELLKTVAAGPRVIEGIDVSSYQGEIDWAKVRDAGKVFAFIKASEGPLLKDKLFDSNWKSARENNVICGAYHYFHSASDGRLQAEFLARTVGPLRDMDLPCVMDWESGTPTDAGRAQGKIFLEVLAKLTGKIPIIYGSPYFLKDLGLGNEFSNFQLWIAHYGVLAPMVPSPWTNWAFHQYTENGSVDGINDASVDMNTFNGDLAALMALTKFARGNGS